MKWIPIDKAKVKFGVKYLIAVEGDYYDIGKLSKTEQTENGLKHYFITDELEVTSQIIDEATHIAIITDPNKKEE